MTTLTLARPYAQAAYDAAKAADKVTLWSDALQVFAQMMQIDKVQAVLKNPQQCRATVIDLMMSSAEVDDAHIKNFLSLLAQYHRLPLLPDISTLFVQRWHEDENQLDAQLVAATPVSAANQEKIKQRLMQRFNCQINLQTQVDPSLMGGALVRIGDQVIDGSIKSKISELTKHLQT